MTKIANKVTKKTPKISKDAELKDARKTIRVLREELDAERTDYMHLHDKIVWLKLGWAVTAIGFLIVAFVMGVWK